MGDLDAYRVADTTAAPILRTVGHLNPAAAKRLGYAVGGLCAHCADLVAKVDRGAPWTHRRTGIESCEWSAVQRRRDDDDFDLRNGLRPVAQPHTRYTGIDQDGNHRTGRTRDLPNLLVDRLTAAGWTNVVVTEDQL